ncbi:hypothetical protein BDK51DRAFT_48882 [Blyttiomyces helicus]|uniref:Uncharacterized protein n=1 Tax=Blyttiomyces helicus TaxID=388810 RepID=A0A4P9W1G7_9FUNG|nr:hypothetical protein BDK51DRAFT_48882 [Blyttiomyces helicus]|eukprot:RKO84568.1 hypothetical protein BDK51DRAFT_48882 [Blyttiomyces helicus]
MASGWVVPTVLLVEDPDGHRLSRISLNIANLQRCNLKARALASWRHGHWRAGGLARRDLRRRSYGVLEARWATCAVRLPIRIPPRQSASSCPFPPRLFPMKLRPRSRRAHRTPRPKRLPLPVGPPAPGSSIPDNLHRFALVYKTWFRQATESMLESPCLDFVYDLRELKAAKTLEAMDGVFNFGVHVRHIDIPLWHFDVELLGSLWCPSLRSLKINEGCDLRKQPICNLESLAAIFHGCPQLIGFHFSGPRAPIGDQGFWESEKGTHFKRGISRLRLLTVEVLMVDNTQTLMHFNEAVGAELEQWVGDGPWASQIQAVAQAPNLKRLAVRATAAPFFNGVRDNIILHTTALTSVRLLDPIQGFAQNFPLLLAACPHLDELDVGENHIDDAGFEILGQRPHLALLRAPGTGYYQHTTEIDTVTKYLTLRGKKLSRLTLPFCHYHEARTGEAIAAALITSAPNLVMVDFGKLRMPVDSLRAMIARLPNLEVVGIKERRVNWERDVRVGPLNPEETRRIAPMGLDLRALAGVDVV